jgi:enterochelin esterase-like enzyme
MRPSSRIFRIAPAAALLSVLAVVLPPSATAQQKSRDVVIGSVYTFAPKAIKGTIEISVHLPEGYAESGAAYPVLYLFDIEKDFVFASAVADFLAAVDRIPPLIVVDVNLANVSGAPPQAVAFLENELIPFVASNFRTQPCRVLYGHSGRSFAALFIFLNRPDLFYGAICAGLGLSSPPWTTAVDFVRLADQKLSAPADPKTWNKSLYFALGDEKPFYPGTEKFRDVLAAKAPPGLDWTYEVMPGEDHFSTKLKALYAGLEHVFRGYYPPLEAAAAGADALKAHYERLSSRLGYPLGLPSRPIHRAVMNWIAYQDKVDLALSLAKGLKDEPGLDGVFEKGDLLFAASTAVNSDRLDDAMKIYAYLCAAEPANPAGFNGLGEAYEKSGRPELALPRYEEAVRLARAANDPDLIKYEANLNRLKKTGVKKTGVKPTL